MALAVYSVPLSLTWCQADALRASSRVSVTSPAFMVVHSFRAIT